MTMFLQGLRAGERKKENNFRILINFQFFRIAGGQSASKGQFPYQVLMYMKDSSGNTFICGRKNLK